MKDLTKRQRGIFNFLLSYVQENGYPPTIREIGEHFQIFVTAARNHLKALEKKGLIRISPYRSRGIDILSFKPSTGFMLPVAGKITAGKPILAREDIEAHILVDKSLFPYPNAFSLKIKGDSMVEAGIHDGDYVVVRPQRTIENGEIGVVMIEDEATIKRVYKEKKRLILRPENRNMKPSAYNLDEVAIIGKVIGVIRKI